MIYKLQIIGLQIVQLLSPHMALWTAKQPPGEVERAEDLLPTGDSHCLGDPDRDIGRQVRGCDCTPLLSPRPIHGNTIPQKKQTFQMRPWTALQKPVSYSWQCFEISPQPNGAGRVTLYSLESEAELRVPEVRF